MFVADIKQRLGRQVVQTPAGEDGRGDFDLSWIGRSTGRAERRQIVVLAIGFAPMAALDPEDIVDLLADRRSLVSQVVARYGGKVVRADPDLQIASWGWPVASEADTQLAVAAGLEITRVAGAGMHCGIDAGIAITPGEDDLAAGIGVVGEMLGEATALQRKAEGGSVLISETLRRLIGGAFECARDGDSTSPAGSWRVVRRAPQVSPSDMAPAWELVGRSREVSFVLDCWRSAMRGTARPICLEGETGVGKSALVARLRRAVMDDGGLVVAVHCLPETQHLPFEPFRHILDALTMELPGGPHSVGLPLREMAGTIDALAAACAVSRPLLIVVEDLQWADPGSLAELTELSRCISARAGVLLVTTMRPAPGEKSANQCSPSGQILHIPRLSAAQIERILAAGNACAGLSPDSRRRIAEHADGIPRYAVELARLCIEMPDSEAHHRLLSRPNRINAELTSRLDALAALKPLAQAAAVLGRRFDCGVLAVMLQMDARVLEDRLGMLVSLGILEPGASQAAKTFRFTQALLWSQSYGSVLKARRRQLHARAAAVLTVDFAPIAAAMPEAIAHHYRKAGDPGRAFEWWCRAAHAAAALGSPATAIAHLSMALAAKDDAPDVCDAIVEAELLSLLGAQRGVLRGNASRESVAAYERVLQLVEALPARPAELGFDIGWGLAAIQLVSGNIRDAVTMSGRLLEQARESNRDDAMLLALRMHGTARLLSGRVSEAVELLTHAFHYYDRVAHVGLRVRYVSDPGAVALAHLSSAQALAGKRAESFATRERALKLAGDIAHPHTSANVLGVLALAAVHLDDTGIAAALARASQAIAVVHDHAYWAARADLIIAWEEGRRFPERGVSPIGAAVERYHRTGAGRASVVAHCLAADVAIRAGDSATAIGFLEPIVTNGERHGEWLYAPEVLRLRALALSRLGTEHLPEAVRLFTEAERLARAQGTPDFAARAARDRSGLDGRKGNGPGRRTRALPPRDAR